VFPVYIMRRINIVSPTSAPGAALIIQEDESCFTFTQESFCCPNINSLHCAVKNTEE